MTRPAILISAKAEWQALKDLLTPAAIHTYPYGQTFTAQVAGRDLDFFHTGWGKIASAGSYQYILSTYQPPFAINLGTCGGFEGDVAQGEILLVTETFIYDIVELMGDFGAVQKFFDTRLDLSWLTAPWPASARPGVFASADGDLLPAKIPALRQRGACAADWESGALAWVAHKNAARLLILRGVSDLVHENGGEAYGNIELFRERTRGIMRRLLQILPEWLDAIPNDPSLPARNPKA